MDVDMIPIDLDGDFDPTNMDIWLNKRLKFEVFWEDCRMCYKRLQFLPQTLQRIFKEVSKSVWDVKQRIVLFWCFMSNTTSKVILHIGYVKLVKIQDIGCF